MLCKSLFKILLLKHCSSVNSKWLKSCFHFFKPISNIRQACMSFRCIVNRAWTTNSSIWLKIEIIRISQRIYGFFDFSRNEAVFPICNFLLILIKVVTFLPALFFSFILSMSQFFAGLTFLIDLEINEHLNSLIYTSWHLVLLIHKQCRFWISNDSFFSYLRFLMIRKTSLQTLY